MGYEQILKLIDQKNSQTQLESDGTYTREPNIQKNLLVGHKAALAGAYCDISDDISVAILIVVLVNEEKPLNMPHINLNDESRYILEIKENDEYIIIKSYKKIEEILKRIPDLHPKNHIGEINIIAINFANDVMVNKAHMAAQQVHAVLETLGEHTKNSGLQLNRFQIFNGSQEETNLLDFYDTTLGKLDEYLVENNLIEDKLTSSNAPLISAVKPS